MNGWDDYGWWDDYGNYYAWDTATGGAYPDLSAAVYGDSVPISLPDPVDFSLNPLGDDFAWMTGVGVDPEPVILDVPANWNDFWAETAQALDSTAIDAAYTAQQQGKSPLDFMTQQALEQKAPGASIWEKIANVFGGGGSSGGAGGIPSGGTQLPKTTPTAGTAQAGIGAGTIALLAGAFLLFRK